MKIFEGDIIRTTYPDVDGVVKWDAFSAGFLSYITVKRDNDPSIFYVGRFDKDDKSVVEIIGNIHDNPELLNGGDSI